MRIPPASWPQVPPHFIQINSVPGATRDADVNLRGTCPLGTPRWSASSTFRTRTVTAAAACLLICAGRGSPKGPSLENPITAATPGLQGKK